MKSKGAMSQVHPSERATHSTLLNCFCWDNFAISGVGERTCIDFTIQSRYIQVRKMPKWTTRTNIKASVLSVFNTNFWKMSFIEGHRCCGLNCFAPLTFIRHKPLKKLLMTLSNL